MDEGLASSRLQYEARIQVLEKELSRYMWANQELNQRLSNLSLPPGQTKGEREPRLGLCCSCQAEREFEFFSLAVRAWSQEQRGCRSLPALASALQALRRAEALLLLSLDLQSFPAGMERSIHGAGDRAMPVLGPCEECSLGEQPGPEESHRARDESRDLVHAPLPSTWRRSSLPSDSPGDLRQQRDTEPLLRAGQPPEGHLPRSLAPSTKRRELRRASLNVTPVPHPPAMIDVRKNPL